ncbi:MAG: methyltransferase domain-containing protein [Pseudomonadota bacterium]
MSAQGYFDKAFQSSRRLIADYWIAMLALSLCALIAVNGRESPSLALWLFAMVAVSAAFLVACGRLYNNLKINGHILMARLRLRPRTASPHYVRALFDGYAEEFDHHLMVELSYRVPNLLVDMLDGHICRGARVIADLGCGTGVCGPLVARYAEELIGVDLSPKMLEIAERKNCYDRLVEGDVLDFLIGQPNSIDLCLAADVLVYFGDLEAVFGAVRGALREGGLFAFTVEVTEEKSWVLTPTGRYAHPTHYVKRLARDLGFQVVSCRRETLRTQSDKPVLGNVWLLKKKAFNQQTTPSVKAYNAV